MNSQTPNDKLMLVLESHENHEIAPELKERMQTQLAGFREKLKKHPYVKAQQRWRGWHLMWVSLRYALLGIIVLVTATAMTEAGRHRIYLLLDDMGRMAMRGEWKLYNATMDKADLVPPAALENAHMERYLGLTPDRKSILLLVQGDGKTWAEQTSSASIWSVEIQTGRMTAVQKGKVLEHCTVAAHKDDGSLGALAYMARPRSMRLKPGSSNFELPNEQLWIDDFKTSPTLVDQGLIAGRYFSLSPDAKSLAYVRMGIVFQIGIYDIATKQKRMFDGELGMPIGWYDDQTLVTMAQSKTRAPSVTTFRKISIHDGKVIEELDVKSLFATRGILGDPEFSRGNYFATQSRDHKFFTESHEDRIDIFSVNPLKHVCSIDGFNLFWTSDGTHAVIKKSTKKLEPVVVNGRNTGARSAETSTGIGIFDATSGRVTDLDLAKLEPAFGRIGPSRSTFVADEASAISSTLLATMEGKSGFGLLDLVSGKILHTYKDFAPNVAVWSPAGNKLALRAREGDVKNEFKAFMLDAVSGKTTDLGFEHMRPIEWLDDQTVVWMNRWSGQDPKEVGPFQIVITDIKTGEKKNVVMHE